MGGWGEIGTKSNVDNYIHVCSLYRNIHVCRSTFHVLVLQMSVELRDVSIAFLSLFLAYYFGLLRPVHGVWLLLSALNVSDAVITLPQELCCLLTWWMEWQGVTSNETAASVPAASKPISQGHRIAVLASRLEFGRFALQCATMCSSQRSHFFQTVRSTNCPYQGYIDTSGYCS